MAEKYTLKVVGSQTMHCAGCQSTVETTLKRLPGVQQVRANFKSQLIELELDPDRSDLEKVKAELDWIGYQVVIV